MTDLVAELVHAVISGAGESLGTRSAELVGSLISALRARFQGDARGQEMLEIVTADPRNATVRHDLEALLRERIRDDAEFGAWLEALWSEMAPQIAPQIRADASRSANIVHGTVHGNVVQARDINGGVHIGRGGNAASG